MNCLHIRILPLSLAAIGFGLAWSGCSAPAVQPDAAQLRSADETHLENLHRITQCGINSGATWLPDGARLTYQHAEPGSCLQTYSMRTDGGKPQLLSNGKGRIGGSALIPGTERILLSSTSAAEEKCIPTQETSNGVLTLDPKFQLYTTKIDGSDLQPLEASAPHGYNSDATACKDGSVVFTSDREGDPELYRGKLEPAGTLSELRRLTHADGLDAQATFSSDCGLIAWTASRPREGLGSSSHDYDELIKQHQVRIDRSEIWISDADGQHARQLTRLGAASFDPVFQPDGKHLFFSSDVRAPGKRSDLFRIAIDGTGLEQVSFPNPGTSSFDRSPSFSQDGRTLTFSSNRACGRPGDLDILVANWVEGALPLHPEADAPARFKGLSERIRSETAAAEQFAAAGLKPLFLSGTFLQKVEKASGSGKRIVATYNVAGMWGPQCPSRQPVVLSAHWASGDGSGIAALLESARFLQSEKTGCFVFAALAGGPKDPSGGARFSAWLETSGIRPKADLYIERASNLEENRLWVNGLQTAKEWNDLLSVSCGSERLHCEEGGESVRSVGSPQTPYLIFASAPRPGALNATGGMQIARVVATAAARVAVPTQRLVYQKIKASPAIALPPAMPNRSATAAYLGAIPDYAAASGSRHLEEGPGVRFAGVKPGSPASKAGVKPGDVLTEIEESQEASGKALNHKIRSIEDFMDALGNLQPGEKVTLHLRRSAQTLLLPAELGKRGN